MAETFDQFDLYEPGDRVQRALVLARQAAAAFGIPELATRQHLDERTLRNQLDRRKREDKGGTTWKMSEDTLITLLVDETHVGRTFRERLLAVCNEQIADIGDITPEQFIRDVTAMALMGDFGNDGRQKVVSLERRLKKSEDWKERARAEGWLPPGEARR